MTSPGPGPDGNGVGAERRPQRREHQLFVRVRDPAGNWSTVSTHHPCRAAPLYYSTAGNSNPPGVSGTADDSDIYYWSGTAHSRSVDPCRLPTANVDGFNRVDATHYYVSFADDTTLAGLGAVQDEDVVFWNGTTWSVFFDGTARGLTTAAWDLDAISVVSGTLYFSTTATPAHRVRVAPATTPTSTGGTVPDVHAGPRRLGPGDRGGGERGRV